MSNDRIPADWLPHYSYEDYKQWEGHWELIRGIPYAMSPSPKRVHQMVGRKLMRLFEDSLFSKSRDCNCSVYYELDWIVNDSTVVRPDIMVVCGTFTDDYLRFPPTVVIEITSAQTRLADRNIKFRLYEANGVRYYLMVDPERQIIETYVLHNNQFVDASNSGFVLDHGCTLDIDFTSIWQ